MASVRLALYTIIHMYIHVQCMFVCIESQLVGTCRYVVKSVILKGAKHLRERVLCTIISCDLSSFNYQTV